MLFQKGVEELTDIILLQFRKLLMHDCNIFFELCIVLSQLFTNLVALEHLEAFEVVVYGKQRVLMK